MQGEDVRRLAIVTLLPGVFLFNPSGKLEPPATRTFLDSSILIDAWKGKSREGEAARELVSDSKRPFIVSDFLYLELLPHPQYFKNFAEVKNCQNRH